MPIKFFCKSCQQFLSIAGRKAGTDIDCPRCGEIQTVPSRRDAEAAMAMTRSHRLGETDATAAESPFIVYDPIDSGVPDGSQFDRSVHSSADRPSPVGMILLQRRTLVFQGILLAVLPMAGLALGYFFGRIDSSPPVDAAPLEPAPEEVLMQGKIVWEETTGDNAGKIVGDEGAVIIALPDGVFPESTLSIQDIRPQDPYPSSDHKSLERIGELGGLYTRADASGLFPLVFPDRGRYKILLISRNVVRRPDSPIDEDELRQIKRYFIRGEDLIGRHEYRWSTEEIGPDSPPIEHSFGRGG